MCEQVCFRASEAEGYAFLPQPLSLPFIAAAAINRPRLKRTPRGQRLSQEDASIMRRKLAAVLAIGLEHGHDAVVLSAFGCGAFKNPPAHIAEICHELLGTPASNVAVLLGDNGNHHYNHTTTA